MCKSSYDEEFDDDDDDQDDNDNGMYLRMAKVIFLFISKF